MPVDFIRLQNLLIKASEQLQQVRGKELVLVIGRTGSGKSTLINYLQGYNFLSKEDQSTGDTILEQLCLSNPPPRSPEIGHSGVSQTLYPDVYHLSGETYVCDTAGFEDNRGDTEQLFCFLAVQMAVIAAKHVRAVIAVVEEAELGSGRGAAFRKMAQTLSFMFQSSEYSTSLFMVFNKGKKTNKQLLVTMDRIMTEQAKIAQDTENTKEARQAASSVEAVLSIFLKNKKIVGGRLGASLSLTPNYDECRNVMALVPTAQECRQLLSRLIDAARPIPREALGIAMDTRNRNDLERILYNIATDGRKWIRDKQTAEETLASKTDELNRITADTLREEARIQEIKLMLDSNNNLDRHEDIVPTAALVNSQREVLSGVDSRLVEQDTLIQNMTQQLSAIESDTAEVEIGQQSYDERAVYGEVKKGIVHTYTFSFNTTDVPITRMSQNLESGTTCATGSNARFYNEHQDGSYRRTVVYDTPSDFYGIASCKIYAEKRHTADAKARATNLRDDLQRAQRRRQTTQTDRDREEQHLRSLQQRLGQQRTETRAQLEQTKGILEANVRNKTSNIQSLNIEINGARGTKEQSESYLNSIENKQRFKMLFTISDIMNVTGEAIIEFKSLYNALPTTLRFAEVSQQIQSGLHFQYSSSSSNQAILQNTVSTTERVASINQLRPGTI